MHPVNMLEKPQVILVHQDPAIRTGIGRMLQSQVQVLEALNIQDCLKLAGVVRPALVIASELLDDGTGADLSRQMQDSVATRDIPVVLLMPAGGPVAWLPEPVTPATLCRTVQAILDRPT